ncbi:MAG: hypothetical protein FD129_692, partial [bacterium]
MTISSNFMKLLGLTDGHAGGFDGEWIGSGPVLPVTSPIDGATIGSVTQVTEAEYDRIVSRA